MSLAAMISPVLREGLPIAVFLAATTWKLSRELATGVADGRFVRTRRDAAPRRYWINIGLSAALLAAGVVFGVWRAAGWG